MLISTKSGTEEDVHMHKTECVKKWPEHTAHMVVTELMCRPKFIIDFSLRAQFLLVGQKLGHSIKKYQVIPLHSVHDRPRGFPLLLRITGK